MIKKFINSIIALCVIALLSAFAVWYFHYQNIHPSTDNAYVQAHTVSIAPQINATVQTVLIKNNETVTAGQTLIQLDPKPFEIALKKAQANLSNTEQTVKAEEADVTTAKANVAQAQAVLINSQKNADRVLSLVKQKLIPQAQGDQATSDLSVAEASVKQAQAQLTAAQQTLGDTGDQNAAIQAAKSDIASAKLNLQYTTIKAPNSGQVANLTVRPGDQLTAYNAIFSIVSNQQWWVDANFKETQLAHIKKGQTVRITTDMYPDHTYSGVVDSISIGSGTSFSLLPTENATGNWVKVTQRFPVKILITDNSTAFPLRLGASAKVTVDTTHG